MNTLETNIYPIENLADVAAKYVLYRVRGLSPEQEEFHHNANILATRVSRQLLSPVAFLQRDGSAWLAIRQEDGEPKSPQGVVRRTVYLEKGTETIDLDFGRLDNETRPIALRFIQFAVHKALRKRGIMWQPSANGAFFHKDPQSIQQGIGLYRGHIIRAMSLSNNRIGLCVDTRHRYISQSPLPTRLDRRGFQRFKMGHVIYRYGHAWFEVRLTEWSELTAQEHLVKENGHEVNLLEYIQEKTAPPMPPELVQLQKDCSVVHYFNTSKELRAAPSALCYPVFDTSDIRVRRAHGRTLLAPYVREESIQNFVERHLQKLVLGETPIHVAPTPLAIERKSFAVPDLKFGGGKVLSARRTAGAQQVSLNDLGRSRLDLLLNRSAGFVVTTPLQRQFFFIPETINRSWGRQFLQDLTAKITALYPTEGGYSPEVIVYDDRRSRTFVDQGMAILKAAKEHDAKAGFAVVMIHEPAERRTRKPDQLAAYAVRALRRDCDITAAVIHSATGNECYEQPTNGAAPAAYRVRGDKRGKLDGYLRTVAISKVLLTNEKWPFILGQKMHADLTIGVDVKSHFAGFIAVGKGGEYIAATRGMECRQPEQVSEGEFRKLMKATVQDYVNATGDLASTVAIHRDGRMFDSEIRGAKAAFETLIAEGLVAPNATLTCVEIGKSSFTSLRLFDVKRNGNPRPFVSNPEVGDYFIAGPEEGYICATGRAFPRDGTVCPLHVRKVFGPMSLSDILEDIYWLTVLAWTKPDDCTRYPITIKLNDRRLFEDAGEFDEHEVNLYEEEVNV